MRFNCCISNGVSSLHTVRYPKNATTSLTWCYFTLNYPTCYEAKCSMCKRDILFSLSSNNTGWVWINSHFRSNYIGKSRSGCSVSQHFLQGYQTISSHIYLCSPQFPRFAIMVAELFITIPSGACPTWEISPVLYHASPYPICLSALHITSVTIVLTIESCFGFSPRSVMRIPSIPVPHFSCC